MCSLVLKGPLAQRLIPVIVKNNSNHLFSTTSCVCGRKSRTPYDKRFSMTLLGSDVGPNVKGGTREMLKEIGKRGDMPQPPGYVDKKGNFHLVPEMIPEFVVPDLAGFKLKPYVSYKVPEVTQSELTPEDLFTVCYAQDIADAHEAGKVDEANVEEFLDKTKVKDKGKS